MLNHLNVAERPVSMYSIIVFVVPRAKTKKRHKKSVHWFNLTRSCFIVVLFDLILGLPGRKTLCSTKKKSEALWRLIDMHLTFMFMIWFLLFVSSIQGMGRMELIYIKEKKNCSVFSSNEQLFFFF